MKKLSTNIASLQGILGNRLKLEEEIRSLHAEDISWHPALLPDAVCYPQDTEEVAEIVKICAKHKTPIVPFGAGTSLEGHIIPQRGGISLDMSRMNQVLSINPIDKDCVVEAGVKKLVLNEQLKKEGLFFAAGPNIDASLGGIAATAASGANAVRYGTARENIRALRIVTAKGEIMDTGRRVKKHAAGYDLTHLMIGSEGTLGIITEVTAILHPIPQHAAVAVISFPNMDAAIGAALALGKEGLPLAMLEFMDETILKMVNTYCQTDYPCLPSLFLELHGEEEMVENYQEKIGKLSSQFGGSGFKWGTESQDKEELWKARYNAAYAAKDSRPGGALIPTDVCVPISMLAQCIREIKEEIQDIPLTLPFLGHVGDGNFHITPCIMEDDPAEVKWMQELNHRLICKAQALGGTCTGEHGIGIGKKAYLKEEAGPVAIAIMKSIKKALDPDDILNPGKIFD
ncbi:MAG: FAD-linked oxidase C-terminal domain-containing protein [Bacteroidia bacterium]|nr:FAD-linked oxidase C-terminal domain-containing protein [Bacteroidia bacterium]